MGLPEDDLGLTPAERVMLQGLFNRTLTIGDLKTFFVKKSEGVEPIDPFHAGVAICKNMKDYHEGKPKTEAYKGRFIYMYPKEPSSKSLSINSYASFLTVLVQLETFLDSPVARDIPSPSISFHRAVFSSFIHHKSTSMR